MSNAATATRQAVPVLVALANARRPRRAPRARQGRVEDPFGDLRLAMELLAPLRPTATVTADDLAVLARLADEVSEIASALANQRRVPKPRVLNTLAAQVPGHRQLRVGDEGLTATTEWQPAGISAELARRVIDELGGLDPVRLRECARQECSLVFYDTTRSNTQRWHAEDPCGWYERQTKHRNPKARRTAPAP